MGKVGFRTSTQPTSLNYHGKQTPKNMGKVGFRTSTQPTSLMRNRSPGVVMGGIRQVIEKLSEKKLINDRL
jgi:hypothetical protein